MRFHVSQPVFRIDHAAIGRTVDQSPQKEEQLKRIAQDMRNVAQRHYQSQEIGTGTGATGQSFEARSFRGGWVVSLSDPKSVWVEAGARAGGTTPVLNYRPLRAAMDHAESQSRNLPSGFLAPLTSRG